MHLSLCDNLIIEKNEKNVIILNKEDDTLHYTQMDIFEQIVDDINQNVLDPFGQYSAYIKRFIINGIIKVKGPIILLPFLKVSKSQLIFPTNKNKITLNQETMSLFYKIHIDEVFAKCNYPELSASEVNTIKSSFNYINECHDTQKK